MIDKQKQEEELMIISKHNTEHLKLRNYTNELLNEVETLAWFDAKKYVTLV